MIISDPHKEGDDYLGNLRPAYPGSTALMGGFRPVVSLK
jgi:hypothetical protein